MANAILDFELGLDELPRLPADQYLDDREEVVEEVEGLWISRVERL